MTFQLEASIPVQVQGLPQPSDRFPYRYRNQAPLILRQIVPNQVLDQWSNEPDHVIQSLSQQDPTKQQTPGQINSVDQVLDVTIEGLAISGVPDLNKEETGSSTTAPKESSSTKIAERIGTTTGAMEEAAHTLVTPPSSPSSAPLLTVMVAEDTKNFMDNPQFTKKIEMSAKEIVDRVLLVSHPNSTASCPLCDTHTQNTHHNHNHNDAQDNQDNHLNNKPKDDRFYYRGKVPSSLYSDLQIPALLDSLSLPKESTSFAKVPNKDLMRIWISLAGATTPLHYDKCHGILIQVVGRKRFVVFSHEDTNLLYPYDGLSGPRHASKVRGLGHCFPFKDQAKEEDAHLKENKEKLLERWPRVDKVSAAWVIDLEPGDALYTPPGFWHEVTSVDHSVSVTVAWDMDMNEIQEVPPHMAF